MLSKFARFAAPCAVAAVAGAACTGLLEALTSVDSWLAAIAAIGFVALLGVPILFVVGMLSRLLWRAWGMTQVFEAIEEDEDAGRRVLAWGLCWIAGVAGLVSSVFHILRFFFVATGAKNVIAVGAALAIPGAALAIFLLSKPVARLLVWILAKLGARWTSKRDSRLLTPRRIVVSLLVATVAMSYGVWRLLVWRNIGHFDLSWLISVIVGLLAFIPVQIILASARRRVVLASSAAAGLVLVATIASAAWVMSARPYTLLALWGDSALAGGAVDKLFGVHELRDNLDLGEFEPVARAGAPHPSVILITIDTVRADRTPMYGGPAKMPWLRKFAARGAIFDWAFSPGNVTRRSIPSMVTGLSPRRIRGRVAGWALRLDPRHVLLAERFKAAGYQTAGFFCCRSHFGKEHKLGLNRGIDHLVIEYNGKKLTKLAHEWLGARKDDRPAFVWLHIIEPHNWNKDFPRRKHGGNNSRRYDMSLETVDEALEPLLKRWSEKNEANPIVLITADHGEGLGDHGVRFHAGTLFNSEIHVPLVAVGPGIKPTRVVEPVSLVNLAPTLLELAGYEAPGMPNMDGRSFADLVLSKRAPSMTGGRAYATVVRDRSVKRDQWALVSGFYKLVIDGPTARPKLFDIRKDRGERKDLSSDEPELVEQLSKELAERRRIDRLSPF